jgi:tetratricopeptide (TPR) repeat protein
VRRWLLTALVSLCVLGCESADVGRVYQAERDYFRADRLRRRLAIHPEAVTDADRRRVADAFRAVGDRYRATLTPADTIDVARVQCVRVGSRAHLVAAEAYLDLGDHETARAVAADVREYMAWSPGTAMVAQARLVDALAAQEKLEEALAATWVLATDFPSASRAGEIYQPSFAAPMNAVELARMIGDPSLAAASASRALSYYEGVAEAWPRKTVALLSDLNQSTLLVELGRVPEATSRLERVLHHYPESVLGQKEASAVALRLGQLYTGNPGTLEQGIDAFERARRLEPRGPSACDAILALAAIRADQGRDEEALLLYREAQQQRPDDPDRSAVARFGRAQVLERSGRWDEALTEYRALQAAYPRSPQGLEVPFVLAAHYRATQAEELALSTLRKASDDLRAVLAARPEANVAFGTYRYLARALVEQRDWAGAVEVMSEFAASFPEAPEGAMALLEAASVCRQQLGDAARAAELLDRVQAGYPNTEFAESAARQRES